MSAKVWSICSKGCDKYQNNGASPFTCCIGQICKISGLLKLHLQHQNGLKLTYINAAAEKMSLYFPYVIPLPRYYRQHHGYLGMPSSGFRSWAGWKPGQKRGEKINRTPGNNKLISIWWKELPDQLRTQVPLPVQVGEQKTTISQWPCELRLAWRGHGIQAVLWCVERKHLLV